jgi:hypothetical protein
MQRALLGTRRIGRAQGDHHDQRDQPGHQHIDQRPAHPPGHDQRQRAAHDRGDAIAELIDRREQLHAGLLVRHVDPPGIDRHVLRGRSQRAQEREQAKVPMAGPDRWRQAPGRPAPARPGTARSSSCAAQPLQPRQRQPIHQRRPQELERIGQPDPRQHADRRQVDLHFAQPGVERADQQGIGQARREAETQHRGRFARLQRQLEQAPALGTGAGVDAMVGFLLKIDRIP